LFAKKVIFSELWQIYIVLKVIFLHSIYLTKVQGNKRRINMIEPIFVISNNPMSREKFTSKYNVEFIEGNVIEVFKKIRDYVHLGHRILTHPLMSSIKPNETPYRTVILSKNRYTNTDVDSLMLIENSIMTTEKFLRDFSIPNWSEKILLDFQLIDYDLVSHAVN
jgi:hypothetical protein